MSPTPRTSIRSAPPAVSRPIVVLLGCAIAMVSLAPVAIPGAPGAAVAAGPDHLVVSEVVTGGASASDELIELYNPTDAALPLEGLEVVYVTASGATISRRAAWELGAPSVPARGHVLVANEAGVYAGVADARYASGMAATGGSVAIRIQGASAAIDAVGWGTAASTWQEGAAAPAPAAGSSLERLPGGAAGSTQDMDLNAADFVVRAAPEPQNLLSAPTPDPSPTPIPSATSSPTPSPASPGPSATAGPTPTPTATPQPTAPPTTTPTPGAVVVPIAQARAATDGATVTVEGVSLTGSAFHDGGGFVADASGGIAVLPDAGGFERGRLLRITGEVDDRFSQRTLRVEVDGIVVLGEASAPEPITTSTGALGEAEEGRLVRLVGTVAGSPSELSTGLAFDLDDGSGPARVVVGTGTGIATDGWTAGTNLTLVGIAGQRDSTGSGSDGYRLLPRDPGDVLAQVPPASPSPTLDPGAPSPSPSEAPPAGVVTVAAARQAEHNARLRIRGVVTLPTGLVDERTAVVQDATGAIALRLGGDAGALARGARVEVDGARSTLGGMETLRVTKPATVLGAGAEPSPSQVPTGSLGEAHEARLVSTRGAIVAAARRSSSGTVTFEIDDGSGPVRVTAVAALGVDRTSLAAGAWIEVRGVLGQETTRARPAEGYRIWPRSADELRVVAPATATEPGAGPGIARDEGPTGGGGPAGLGDALGAADLARLRVGATLVVGAWPEVGVAGLLWDGSRLVAVDAGSAPTVARVTDDRSPPLALDLGGLARVGGRGVGGSSVVRLGTAAGDVVVLDAAPARPRGTVGGSLPAWVSVVGRLAGTRDVPSLRIGDDEVRLHQRCATAEDGAPERAGTGIVAVTGVAFGSPVQLVVPCGGIRAAPSLSRAAGAERPATIGEERSVRLAAATQLGATDPRRGLAAGLVTLASMSLGAAAWLRKRAGPAPRGPGELAAGGPEAEAPARLTLVRVQDEHGS